MKFAIIPIINGDKLSNETLDFLGGMAHGFDVRPDKKCNYLVCSVDLTPDDDYDDDDSESSKELSEIYSQVRDYALLNLHKQIGAT